MIKHIRINPLFVVTIILSWQMGNLSIFSITYLCLIFHEGIHLWFLSKHQIPIRKITVEPFGISIQTQQQMPENVWVYLSAPTANLIVAITLVFVKQYFEAPIFSQWILANLSLGLINLVPILPLDGGRALLLYLEHKIGKEPAKKKMILVTAIILLPALLGFTALILQAGDKFSIITVLIFLCYTFLSGNRFLEHKKLHRTAFRTEKGNLQDAIFVEHIGVPWNYPARKLIKKFQGEKYYVVDVFRDGILLKTVTETQILNRILATNSNLNVLEC